MSRFSLSLTSMGYKILSAILFIALGSLIIVLCVFIKQVSWYAIAFSFSVFCIVLFGCFLCFNHRIVLDSKEKLLKICVLKTKKIKLTEILDIRVDTTNSVNPKKYCFIIINLKNGETYKTSEYSTLIKNNAVKITEEKIKILNQKIKEII